MATLQSLSMRFDETMEYLVNHLGLDGKVYSGYIHHLYLKRVTFHFKHRYLKVLDTDDYPMNDIVPANILENSVNHIMEIRNQFNYYFNAIWC